MVVRDDVAAAPAGDDRDVEQLGELQQVRRRPGPEDAAAGEDDRPARGRDELEHGADVVRLRPGRRGADGVELRALGQDLVEEVLGQTRGEPGRAARPAPRGSRRRRRPGPPTRSAAPRRTRRDHRTSPTWSASWNASRPSSSRSTWPTSANIGVESWRAVWMPIARLAAPTARVPTAAAGRPVSWPWASAMNAAAPSWRVATTRMPAASRPSSRPRKLSPGTVNAYRTPTARRASATNRPTVRAGAGSGSGAGSAGGAASLDSVVGRRLGRLRERRRGGSSARSGAASAAIGSAGSASTGVGLDSARRPARSRLARLRSVASGSARLAPRLDGSASAAAASTSGASAWTSGAVGSVVVSGSSRLGPVRLGRQVVCVPLRRHRGAAAGAATIARIESGNHHDGHDDHRHPRVARPWHHGPVTGSSRTGAAPASSSSLSRAITRWSSSLLLPETRTASPWICDFDFGNSSRMSFVDLLREVLGQAASEADLLADLVAAGRFDLAPVEDLQRQAAPDRLRLDEVLDRRRAVARRR